MRTMLFLIALSLSPALAEAGMNFKCQSIKTSEQISGWIRFGSSGTGNTIQMEYWNGYPPITLVEGALDNGRKNAEGGMNYISETDRSTGYTARLSTPDAPFKLESFQATLNVSKWASVLKCVRH